MDEQKNNKIRLYLTVVLCFVAGLGLAWLLFSTSSPSAEEATTEETNQSLSQGETSVLTEDQIFGLEANVKSVKFESRAGWVAIHEYREGKPGNILGASWLPVGEHADVKVELLRAMEAGKTYYAMLHDDDGDKLFNYKNDLSLPSATGEPIMTAFRALTQ
jgi:hypothetical protein